MKWKILSPNDFEISLSRSEASIVANCVLEAATSIMDVTEIPTRIGCQPDEVEALSDEFSRLFDQANRTR